MKKSHILSILGFFLLFAGLNFLPGRLKALPPDKSDVPDIIRYDRKLAVIVTTPIVITDTVAFRIDALGNILPGQNEFSDVGEPTTTYRRGHFGSLDITSGTTFQQTWINPAASVSTGLILAVISTGGFISTGAVFVTADYVKQPDYPRNITFVSSFSFLTSTVNLPVSATFYGVDAFGRTRFVNYTTRSTNPFYGGDAWASISSFSVIAATAAFTTSFTSFRFEVGFSSSFGFYNVVQSTADIYKHRENGQDNPIDNTNVQISTTFSTIRFETAANGATNYEVFGITRRTRR